MRGWIILFICVIALAILNDLTKKYGWLDRMWDRLFGLPNGKDVEP